MWFTLMFTYTITVKRNSRMIAVFHPKTRADALDTLRSAEDYAAQQCDYGYTITLTIANERSNTTSRTVET